MRARVSAYPALFWDPHLRSDTMPLETRSPTTAVQVQHMHGLATKDCRSGCEPRVGQKQKVVLGSIFGQDTVFPIGWGKISETKTPQLCSHGEQLHAKL